MKLNAGLDYLRVTVQTDLFDMALPKLPDVEYQFFNKGLYGYDRTYGLENKTIAVFWHTTDERMKKTVQLSGSGLQSFRDNGWTDLSILRHYAALGRFTRLDVALDTDNPEASPKDLWTAIDQGRVKTITRNTREIRSKGTENGHTVYVGSQKSNRFVRVYDKSAQLKDLAAFVTRLELVTKHERANAVGIASTLHGAVDVAKAEIVKLIPDFGVGWLNQMVQDANLEYAPLVARTDKNPEKFARGVIIPFLEKSADDLEPQTRATIALLASHGSVKNRD